MDQQDQYNEYTDELYDELYDETEPTYTEEPAEPPIMYGHYIRIDNDRRVVDRWSTGIYPDRQPDDGDILLHEMASLHFRFTPGGVENPPIFERIIKDGKQTNGLPLYRWDGSTIIPRTLEEMEGDRAAIASIPPPPTDAQRIADLEAHEATQDTQILVSYAALTELFEMMIGG